MNKFFIEIGACDFETCLPLAEAGWHGIVLEPNPDIFPYTRDLFKPYKNVMCVEAAVSDINSSIELIKSKGTHWVRGISHIYSDNHLGEKLCEYDKNKKNFGEVVRVDAITLDGLIDSRRVENIDFLKIDAQGHELNILRKFSFRVKPRTVKIEHQHCDDAELLRILHKHGYYCWKEAVDIYGIQ